MNEKKTLASGSVIILQMATFTLASRLMKAVATELKAVKIGDALNLSAGMSPEKLMGEDLPVDALKDLACQLLASDKVEEALRECMKGCQYNGEAITKDTFEPEDARQDYLPAAWEVITLNLSPFFKGLNLRSLVSKAPGTSSPLSG